MTHSTKNSVIGAKALKETLHEAMSNKPGAKTPFTEVKATSSSIQITVHYNTGFNNALFIRGSGANLSWDKGIPLKNVNADTWVWETAAKFDTCEFKVLLNDLIYENGLNRQLLPGQSLEYTPSFN